MTAFSSGSRLNLHILPRRDKYPEHFKTAEASQVFERNALSSSKAELN